MARTRVKAYLYSAISSTFCFVILREMGLIGHSSSHPFADHPLRSLGAPILGAAKKNSKYINDAIISRGNKNKKFPNEAMVNVKSKAVKDRLKAAVTDETEEDTELSSTARLRGRNIRGSVASKKYRDSNGDENDEAEPEEGGRYQSERGSNPRASSRRAAKASRASRGRNDYQDAESSTEDQNDQEEGSREGGGDYEAESAADSYSSRKNSRKNSRQLPNNEENEEEAEPAPNRYKKRPALEADNERDAAGDYEEAANSKYAKQGGRGKRITDSTNDTGRGDADGDYDEGENNGGKGSNNRGARNSGSSRVNGEIEAEDKYDNESEGTEPRGKRKHKFESENGEDAIDNPGGETDAGDNGGQVGKKKARLPEAETESDAESDSGVQDGKKRGRTPVAESDGDTDIDNTSQGGTKRGRTPLAESDIGATDPVSSGRNDNNQDGNEESPSEESSPRVKGAPLLELSKPRIYTFFTGVQDRKANTGMTADADNQLLQTWKEEWSSAGWKPVILSLETAKKHPDFDAINAMLDGPFGEYDRYCFLRWLAVAVVGGGFAVDYDTLPFDFVMNTLPNGGKLTVHENSEVGGVPSLVSASAKEYTKFAWDLVKNLESHKTESHWSDMKAMQDMYQKSNGKAYIMESNVMSALEVLNGRGYDPYNCGIVEGKYGIHFSHHAIKFGKLWEGVGPEDRASVGREWLKGWRKGCRWRVSSELS